MGDTLSTPIKNKEVEVTENERFRVVTCSMQGWRRGMEDAHTAALKMSSRQNDAFFGVFDGHCGPQVAKFCGARLHQIVDENPDYKKGRIEKALEAAFLAADEELKSHSELKDTKAGTTAVTVLVTGDKTIYCANAGDSRAVLCRGNETIDLSIDHKPQLDTERSRIEAAGGFVMLGRVNGNLALSRAIGDFEFKNNDSLGPKHQAVTAHPEIKTFPVHATDRFIVLACDGIWDVKKSHEVVQHFLDHQSKGTPMERACEMLLDECLAVEPGGVGCDNMTVVYVEFKPEFHA